MPDHSEIQLSPQDQAEMGRLMNNSMDAALAFKQRRQKEIAAERAAESAKAAAAAAIPAPSITNGSLIDHARSTVYRKETLDYGLIEESVVFQATSKPIGPPHFAMLETWVLGKTSSPKVARRVLDLIWNLFENMGSDGHYLLATHDEIHASSAANIIAMATGKYSVNAVLPMSDTDLVIRHPLMDDARYEACVSAAFSALTSFGGIDDSITLKIDAGDRDHKIRTAAERMHGDVVCKSMGSFLTGPRAVTKIGQSLMRTIILAVGCAVMGDSANALRFERLLVLLAFGIPYGPVAGTNDGTWIVRVRS
jgi:hypothetical protein